MARIAGVDLPKGKRMEIALTYIFGIGRKSATTILGAAKVDLAMGSTIDVDDTAGVSEGR